MKNEFKLSIILTFFLLVPIVFALNNYDEQYALLNSTLENLDPSIDLNVSYTFPDSKVSGSCTMYCFENCTQYVYVPTSSKVNATAKYKGDCVNETAEEWTQDSSKQTVAGGYAYIKGKLKLCNNASTTFTSVLYNNSLNETVCRDGWFCEVLEGSLDLPPGCSLTDYVVFSSKSNVITKSEGAWNQNTSVISSLLEQYVYKRVYGTNTDPSVSYSNVYWEITPVKWDCIVCSGYFDVSASGSWEANASAKGDNLDEKEAEDWAQDTEKATVAGGYAYIKGKVAAINNAGVDFTNIYFDSSVVSAESRPGWNCSIQSGYIESCTASSCVDNDYSIFCNASNIITREPLPAIINATDITVGVSYDATYNITVNNTDTIPYIEVYVDTSPLETCWAPKVSEVYVDVPALTATNVSVEASGYPVIEKNSSNYIVTTTATYIYYEYKAFLNVRAYDAANHKIIYKVSKSLLSNWDKRDKSLDTYIIDGQSTGFSTFETDTEIIFEIPTTFSASSLEYGDHQVIIKYYVPSGAGPGTAPAGGGGGPVITISPPKFSVFPYEIYLELNKTECTIVNLTINWVANYGTKITITYSEDLAEDIIEPESGYETYIPQTQNITIPFKICGNKDASGNIIVTSRSDAGVTTATIPTTIKLITVPKPPKKPPVECLTPRDCELKYGKPPLGYAWKCVDGKCVKVLSIRVLDIVFGVLAVVMITVLLYIFVFKKK